MYLKKQEPAKAEASFRRAAEINRYDAITQSNLALSLLHQKKIAAAIPYLEAAIDLDPENTTSRQRLDLARQILASQSGNTSQTSTAEGSR